LEFELPCGVSMGRAVDLSRDVQDQQETRFKCITQVINLEMCLRKNLGGSMFLITSVQAYEQRSQGVWRRNHGLFLQMGTWEEEGKRDSIGKRSHSKGGPDGALAAQEGSSHDAMTHAKMAALPAVA
jgi:hypothetical protein